jgi:hypothetical protein
MYKWATLYTHYVIYYYVMIFCFKFANMYLSKLLQLLVPYEDLDDDELVSFPVIIVIYSI